MDIYLEISITWNTIMQHLTGLKQFQLCIYFLLYQYNFLVNVWTVKKIFAIKYYQLLNCAFLKNYNFRHYYMIKHWLCWNWTRMVFVYYSLMMRNWIEQIIICGALCLVKNVFYLKNFIISCKEKIVIN